VKSYLFLFIAMMTLIGCVENGVAQQPEGQQYPKTKVPADLIQKAKETGVVRVIVDLDIPLQSEGKLDAGAKQLQRQAIAEAQNKLLAELAGTKHEGERRLITVPAIGLRVGADALRVLERSVLVKKVTEDRALKSDLKIQEQK
jgi:hypothetical protein